MSFTRTDRNPGAAFVGENEVDAAVTGNRQHCLDATPQTAPEHRMVQIGTRHGKVGNAVVLGHRRAAEPRVCGNTIHIQCDCLSPEPDSSSAVSNTGSWAFTKRSRSNTHTLLLRAISGSYSARGAIDNGPSGVPRVKIKRKNQSRKMPENRAAAAAHISG